jgi:hypothetical protein
MGPQHLFNPAVAFHCLEMFAGIGRGQKITQWVGIPTGSKPLKKSIKGC